MSAPKSCGTSRWSEMRRRRLCEKGALLTFQPVVAEGLKTNPGAYIRFPLTTPVVTLQAAQIQRRKVGSRSETRSKASRGGREMLAFP